MLRPCGGRLLLLLLLWGGLGWALLGELAREGPVRLALLLLALLALLVGPGLLHLHAPCLLRLQLRRGPWPGLLRRHWRALVALLRQLVRCRGLRSGWLRLAEAGLALWPGGHHHLRLAVAQQRRC